MLGAAQVRLGGGGGDAAAAQLAQEGVVTEKTTRLARLGRLRLVLRVVVVRVARAARADAGLLGLLEGSELDLGPLVGHPRLLVRGLGLVRLLRVRVEG